MAELSFTLDGRAVSVEADPKTSTLDVLREQLGVFTSKAGCSPQGLCGCCAVLVDGKPRLTCTLPVKSVVGKAITTIEGLDEGVRAQLADAFVACGASQCGYCTPGFLLSTHALLESNPAPSREEVTRALNLHSCRCTGYTAIYEAVGRAAAARRGEVIPVRARPEGRDIALGARPYVDDLVRPGMLHAAVVFAPVAVGTVEAVELAAAEALPGVRAVLVLRAPGEGIRHAGDAVALVAAEDFATARAAARAIELRVSPREARAFADGGPLLAQGRREDPGLEEALAAAVHRVEEQFELAATDPIFLEPEAALALPEGEGLRVYSAGQDAAAIAASLQAELGLPVRVVLVPSGGSYGGKAGVTVEAWAARLCRATGRPVRLAVDLEEGMRVHPRRPAARVAVRLGADAAGRLLGLQLRVELDGGAAPLAPETWIDAALGAVPYAVPVGIELRVIGSDNPAAGPIRGAGSGAVAFAVERGVDLLAQACGVEARAFRARALPAPGRALLEALPEATGVAVARVAGSGGARVILEVAGPDEIRVRCNVPDLGQGRDEALVAALRRSTGLPASAFHVDWADDRVGPGALGPVDEAAAAAGAALAAGGGRLAERVGTTVVGEAPARGSEAWAAVGAVLGAEGELRLEVVVGVGEGQDEAVARNLAEGAAHMGAGVALSEEVESPAGLPETRFRALGLLKPKGSPEIVASTLRIGPGAREVSEAVFVATPPAVAAAVSRLEGQVRRSLPMKDSLAARGAGVRPKRPA